MEHQTHTSGHWQPGNSNNLPFVVYIIYDFPTAPGSGGPNCQERRYFKIDNIFRMEEFMGLPDLLI